jgi:hypothetical protein
MGEQDKPQPRDMGEVKEGKVGQEIISQKTMDLLFGTSWGGSIGGDHLGSDPNIREKRFLVLKSFFRTMKEMLVEKQSAGILHVSMAVINGSLVKMLEGENSIPHKQRVIVNDDPRYVNEEESAFYDLDFDTRGIHGMNKGKNMGEPIDNTIRDNVTSLVYFEGKNNRKYVDVVLTLGQFNQNKEEAEQLLRECLTKSFEEINSKVEKIDNIEKFAAKAPVKEWKRVFGE